MNALHLHTVHETLFLSYQYKTFRRCEDLRLCMTDKFNLGTVKVDVETVRFFQEMG